MTTKVMVHWCLLDKECRKYTNSLHVTLGKWHYTIFMPYDKKNRIWDMSPWQRPSVVRHRLTEPRQGTDALETPPGATSKVRAVRIDSERSDDAG